MSEKHRCDEMNIDGHYAEIEIDKDGSAEVSAENSDGMDMFITMSFGWCPFCGIKFPVEIPEEPHVERKECHCINFYHGRCMDCGRSLY